MLNLITKPLAIRLSSEVCLIMICLLAGGCGKTHDPNSKAVTEFVLKAGGKVIPVNSDLPIDTPGKIPEGDFAVREIDLTDTKIKDLDMKKIVDLPYLESLNLHGTNLTDKGLAELSGLPELKSLEIAYTRVGDEEVSKLTRFPKLRKIFLYGTALKPQTIEDLKSNLRGCVIYK
ncbi:leucine-rich repeat domain-containing protein [Gimesia fumaroli]|uniref:Leucine Rich repeats (2 copies) n=1 Tax=Gimesia fumaroli TaxID=2527976 RepID=A0A518ID88_9PLAN|nr:leucine-rich repeat domain-containing protein [Gimesia fumaroli]QDV51073.1 Leucine Rich repeats (2 copies) [Gimesia fumaroli]